jgi:hypothetical protein
VAPVRSLTVTCMEPSALGSTVAETYWDPKSPTSQSAITCDWDPSALDTFAVTVLPLVSCSATYGPLSLTSVAVAASAKVCCAALRSKVTTPSFPRMAVRPAEATTPDARCGSGDSVPNPLDETERLHTGTDREPSRASPPTTRSGVTDR